jgi:polyhydroxyalkanoate synthesis regulator phasin
MKSQSDKIQGLVTTMAQENEGHINEVYQSWDELSGKFNETLTGFIDEYNQSYEYIYAQWLDRTKEIGKRFSEAIKEYGTDYENLYKLYFERTSLWQKNPWMVPRYDVQNLNDEVKRLKQKVTALEKKLKSKGTK